MILTGNEIALTFAGAKQDIRPLILMAPTVGEALLDYLKHGRPETTERVLFIGAYAPYPPLSRVAVSDAGEIVSPQGGDQCDPAGLAYAEAHLRSTSRRLRVLAQDDR